MNLYEYVRKYGKYSFDDEPFNEVDNVIFSQLAYLPLSGIVSGFGHRPISLERATKILERKIKKKQKDIVGRFYKKGYKLLVEMSTTTRYRNIFLYNYIKIVDHDKQFGAVTLKLPDNSIYVAYEGTDSSISGWYEDARMTYTFPVPAQELSANYLRRTIRFLDKNVRIGGHSKGGNLAVYAALEAPFYIENKIIQVYNNDGPGFFEEQFKTKKYQKLLPKIQKIVPRESVVGMFLYNGEDITIVKSRNKRLLQHDLFNWVVNDTSFEKDTLSNFSHNVSYKTAAWLGKLEKEKRKECFENLFNAFDLSNIKATYHLYSLGKAKEFVKNLCHIDAESKENLISVFKEMIW